MFFTSTAKEWAFLDVFLKNVAVTQNNSGKYIFNGMFLASSDVAIVIKEDSPSTHK